MRRSQAKVVAAGANFEQRFRKREFEERVLAARPARQLELVRRGVDYVLANDALNAELGSKRKSWRPSDPTVVALWDKVWNERSERALAAAEPTTPSSMTRQQVRHAARQREKAASSRGGTSKVL